MKRKSSGRAPKAIRTLHKAARIANTRPVAFGDEILNRRKAEQAVTEAQDLLEPAGQVVKGAGPTSCARTGVPLNHVVPWPGSPTCRRMGPSGSGIGVSDSTKLPPALRFAI